MSQQPDHTPALRLEDQALNRTIVPAAHDSSLERGGNEHEDHATIW
jgi:hypothetical protein